MLLSPGDPAAPATMALFETRAAQTVQYQAPTTANSMRVNKTVQAWIYSDALRPEDEQLLVAVNYFLRCSKGDESPLISCEKHNYKSLH